MRWSCNRSSMTSMRSVISASFRGRRVAPNASIVVGQPADGQCQRSVVAPPSPRSGPMALVTAAVARPQSPMLVDEGLELLTEDQARGLLAAREIGRMGITIAGLPAIFPVNYRMIDGAIVFRTAPGSKMAAATQGDVVAFEVDVCEASDRSCWSVLAVGKAEVVHDLELALKVVAARLEPFAGGVRTVLVRIEPTFLSGRRIVHE